MNQELTPDHVPRSKYDRAKADPRKRNMAESSDRLAPCDNNFHFAGRPMWYCPGDQFFEVAEGTPCLSYSMNSVETGAGPVIPHERTTH